CEGFHHTLLELAMLAKTATNGTTRNILEIDRNGKFASFASEILHDVRVFEMLHCVDFLIQGTNHFLNPVSVLSGNSWVDVHLLNSQDLTVVGVHAQIHPSICSFANKLTTDDTEGRLLLSLSHIR